LTDVSYFCNCFALHSSSRKLCFNKCDVMTPNDFNALILILTLSECYMSRFVNCLSPEH